MSPPAHPVLRFPADLPITARRDEIVAAIRAHPVVVVAGETGSGKSTQLPKLCLEAGRGDAALIGHTQPRRIAARSVAERVAEELDTTIGGLVGYAVRFTDRVGAGSRIKVMTDGILLAEIQRDRQLRRYDTIIIDEAHERSLNIDFLLGYLKRLLPRRPDLRVIITSATIDTARFAAHFDDAPVIEVSGRSYPVEVRYRPLDRPASGGGGDGEGGGDDSGEDRDQVQGILDAVDELAAEGPGDILVFLSGEREIRDTADALRRQRRAGTEILPLYARLSAAEQHRVFAPHPGRRIVLATNVAETSLTVPGIRYVIDPGTARISRYSRRTKVQRLPIEPISQASADQRAGRCGRVAPGVCIRLYSEDDYLARPRFTEAEILRTNLASVILQMASIGLGDVAAFPFVDPPDARNIADGLALLEELGALETGDGGRRRRGRGRRGRSTRGDGPPGATRLTPLGRRLAQLPLDPRLGRMVLEADRRGCVREVMIIAAALSIQDPRERPTDHRQAADELHARFNDPDSDLLSWLRLWEYLRDQQAQLSSNQFRRLCQREFLNYLRVREWQDIYSQLRQVAAAMGIRPQRAAAEPDAVHQALLAGLLSHIGLRDGDRHEYLGARNARFAIAPGSALFRAAPPWVMAAELVETNRLWARGVARIRPEWAEQLGDHLVKRSYSEPHWDRQRGAVMALERVTLYGVPIVTGRRVGYQRVDPHLARELFIHHALVEGDWDTDHDFFHHNRKLVAEVEALEERTRRRDLLVDDETIFAFYDERVPPGVTSARHFDRWWKDERQRQPDLLNIPPALLVDDQARPVDPEAFPATWHQGPLSLRLTYRLDPGSDLDGVTVHIPLSVLPRVSAVGFEWQVPGLRAELITELLRSLPRERRRRVVPIPDVARALANEVSPADGPLLPTLERALARLTGEPLPPGQWEWAKVADHLKVTFLAEDDSGRPLAYSKDLAALKDRMADRTRATVARAAHPLERSGLTSWTLGELPRRVDVERDGDTVPAYPALVDEGTTVGVRLLASEGEQAAAMWSGTRRLLRLTIPSPARLVADALRAEARLALAHVPHPRVDDLYDDCIDAAVDLLLGRAGGPAWDEAAFAVRQRRVRSDLADAAVAIARTVARILSGVASIEARLDRITAPALQPAVTDVHVQLARLVFPGFVTASGARRLPDILRYLAGIEHRLGKLAEAPRRDQERMAEVRALEERYDRLRDARPAGAELDELGWMLQELRVSLFAQPVGTKGSVSIPRVERALAALAG